ncbi:MAG: M15 family metallopeptidase [Pseudomonadota bacterium]|jgi:peptidoglycan L-alanyl-D-glutamate endopeptidase CwlK
MISARCELRLAGVHPDLVRVVRRAAAGGAMFRVIEGMRTPERQAELMRAGKTQTLNSRHLTGHAVDLAPLVGTDVSWDWKHFFPLADAMADAARAEGVPLIWGGAWGRTVHDWPQGSAKQAQAAYVAERRAAGRKPFLDGPHFELPAGVYP